MCFKLVVLTLACLGGLAAQKVPFKGKRQVSNAVVTNGDPVPAESGHVDPAAAVHAGSKYFQDIYVAMEKPNELQFGHVSETPKAWEQRFEKINLDNLKRQGKVRWGDKHGGYGEHYWDYNHDGNHDGQESQLVSEYVPYGEESQYAPAYAQVDATQRGKREQGLLKDVEFINDKARSLILDGNSQRHGGNYRSADDDYRGKREQHKINGDDLIFKPESGTLFDKRTGRRYELKPIYSEKDDFDF